MKRKKEPIILIIIILLLVSYLLLRKQDRTHYQIPEVPKIKKADITKIEFSKQEGSIVMNRKDNTWRIAPQGYLADEAVVKNIIDIIDKLTH